MMKLQLREAKLLAQGLAGNISIQIGFESLSCDIKFIAFSTIPANEYVISPKIYWESVKLHKIEDKLKCYAFHLY